MGGIDSSDMMLYFYLDERKTVKYWKKVVFNVIGRMVLNAYILYCDTTIPEGQNKMDRFKFTSGIVQTLGQEWMEVKNTSSDPQAATASGNSGGDNNNRPDAQIGFGLTLLQGSKERDCCVCSDRLKGQRKRSRTVCTKCTKGLHSKFSKLHIC